MKKFEAVGVYAKEAPVISSSLAAMGQAYSGKDDEPVSFPMEFEDNPYSKAAQNMINYLDHLDVDQIVTPLRGVSDFIQEDLDEPFGIHDLKVLYQLHKKYL